ncbi:MAG: hypothetical protein M1814_001338 [Vezdaea aestivalis]|nr:MAG: hypothetical protein M1814_001338 [Vezdaea aestivalis]
MILRLVSACVTLAAVASALAPSDIPSDTPVSSLVTSANTNLAQGNYNDALTYFDVAISRDPNDYLTIFKRGATYLSLGRTGQASLDFDKVLAIKPGFEGALLQRAKIRSKAANWDGAAADYQAAGRGDGEEFAELREAQGAAKLAADAEAQGDWESCVSQAGVAIIVAGKNLAIRQRRARCRFERGEVQEGVSDLAHVLQMAPGMIEPHLQMSAMLFFSVADTDRGLAQIKKCLHSDPDSKACSKLLRRMKVLNKSLAKVDGLVEKRQWNSASKLLVPIGEDEGLIQEIREADKELREQGKIHPKSPQELLAKVLETACEAYTEMKNHKKAESFCTETLTLAPNSLPGLLAQSHRQIAADDFEGAIATLNAADEAHPQNQKIQQLQQEAQVLLRRSKQKDYYKVLEISRDSDERTIKRAWRRMTKIHHPDKAHHQGVAKEVAQKKMAAVNEAYEVLSNPELKARFDSGDDPNDQEQQGQPFHGSPFGQGGGGQQFFFRSGGSGGGQQFQFQGGFPGGFHFP